MSGEICACRTPPAKDPPVAWSTPRFVHQEDGRLHRAAASAIWIAADYRGWWTVMNGRTAGLRAAQTR